MRCPTTSSSAVWIRSPGSPIAFRWARCGSWRPVCPVRASPKTAPGPPLPLDAASSISFNPAAHWGAAALGRSRRPCPASPRRVTGDVRGRSSKPHSEWAAQALAIVSRGTARHNTRGLARFLGNSAALPAELETPRREGERPAVAPFRVESRIRRTATMSSDGRPQRHARQDLAICFCLAILSMAAEPFIRSGAPFVLAAETPAARPPVEIGSARGVAGEKVRGALKVAEDADGTPIVLPLTIIAGKKPGPVAWVQAATHGDEYGGARALQEVVRGLDPEAMSGTVIAVMIANPPAFRGLSRVNPNWDDLMDSGDAFPGRDRFTTERIAAAIHDGVKKSADYFVDMHTGGDRFRQHPFVLYSIMDGAVAGGAAAQRLDDLARGFGVPTLWRDTVKIFPTSASTVFSAEGIPGFLLEVGGGQPLDPADIRLQADAIRSFLRTAGILAGPAPPLKSYTLVSGYRIVTNTRGGFLHAE